MRIPRIYLPVQLEAHQSIELNERAFLHVIKVLRLKLNAELILFNGKGSEYSASIESVSKNTAFAITKNIINNPAESELYIHLGIGISKGERMDYAIQKAVELGVKEITPLFTEFCVVNLDQRRIQKRLHHWQGIIISACEQCGRNTLPILNPANSLTNWTIGNIAICIVLDPLANNSLQMIIPESNLIKLLIGPEGGLSENEISGLRIKQNVHLVKLGPRILRTETAAVSAITAIQVLWGDLQD